MKYKVGDKVRIKSLDWYNENKNSDDNNSIVFADGWHFSESMSIFCGKELIIERISHAVNPPHYMMRDNIFAWTDEMIEGLVEEEGKETSWKPSKEEMDVLYGLAYITNKYDEHKEEVITRLYQDLKREFFNGSSYENMFPNTENDVRRRSTIQVLEYARSLDNYNQYGKADIDKNIAWLEKQGKSALEARTDNELVEEEEGLVDNFSSRWVNEFELPEGYIFKDENGNVINATKIVLEKKTNKEMVENNIKVDMGEVSDGYHTFNELYEYRMLYNAALFNEFAKQGRYDVHKSRKHSDGEYPFGDSNWFIVMAELPTGQISNHYEMKDWDKFQIPEKPLANEWDEHSPRDVAERLTSFTTPKKEYPKTYEECCKVLGVSPNNYLSIRNLCCDDGDDGDEDYTNYELGLLGIFDSLWVLRFCRDAYWKLYGEEMGLDKPWEPDWNDEKQDKYGFYNEVKYTIINSAIFVFPTEEMRDAFYENFKELIEQCKIL